ALSLTRLYVDIPASDADIVFSTMPRFIEKNATKRWAHFASPQAEGVGSPNAMTPIHGVRLTDYVAMTGLELRPDLVAPLLRDIDTVQLAIPIKPLIMRLERPEGWERVLLVQELEVTPG